MLLSFSCSWDRTSDIARICDMTFLRARQLAAINFSRKLRDVARGAEAPCEISDFHYTLVMNATRSACVHRTKEAAAV
jgi:hypothetical protein